MSNNSLEKIIINEVGPRDGLQNLAPLSVAGRQRIISALLDANLTNIEVGSFVSPRAVPAMAGTSELVSRLPLSNAVYSALIPNLRGYQLAVDAGIKTVAMVAYTTDGMAQANVGKGAKAVDQDVHKITQQARLDGTDVITTLAVTFECPFEGPVDPTYALAKVGYLLSLGVKRVVLADTIGAANPRQVSRLLGSIINRYGADRLGCHFHDTRAMGLANVYAATTAGVRYFDAAIAGLGGCPFAPGASGNVATEDVVMMLQQMGYGVAVDLAQLMVASDIAAEVSQSASGSRARRWLDLWLAKQSQAQLSS